MRWTEDSVLDAVEAHFDALAPCRMLRQVEVVDRRLDAVVVSPSHYRLAIEVKVSRADFRRETDAKREASWWFAHRCWYAAPEGVIPVDEVPDGWGLLVVHDDRCEPVLRPRHHDLPVGTKTEVIDSLLWRAAALEDRLRHPETGAEHNAALRAALERMEGVLAGAAGAKAREKRRALAAAEELLAFVGEQVCSVCERPITYTSVKGWTHRDKRHESACEPVRAERLRQQRERESGAAYLRGPAPRVIPLALVVPSGA